MTDPVTVIGTFLDVDGTSDALSFFAAIHYSGWLPSHAQALVCCIDGSNYYSKSLR